MANATVRELVELAWGLYPRPLSTVDILATAGLTELADGGWTNCPAARRSGRGSPSPWPETRTCWILDEPTAAMDVATRQSFWAAMRRYAEAGHTVLFATHYLEEADDFADRVVVISAGRVAADGTGAEIKKLVGGRSVSFAPAGRPRPASGTCPE